MSAIMRLRRGEPFDVRRVDGAEQRKRIEELSLLLGERDKGPGEVRA
jgi:hypothetical protein